MCDFVVLLWPACCVCAVLTVGSLLCGSSWGLFPTLKGVRGVYPHCTRRQTVILCYIIKMTRLDNLESPHGRDTCKRLHSTTETIQHIDHDDLCPAETTSIHDSRHLQHVENISHLICHTSANECIDKKIMHRCYRATASSSSSTLAVMMVSAGHNTALCFRHLSYKQHVWNKRRPVSLL